MAADMRGQKELLASNRAQIINDYDNRIRNQEVHIAVIALIRVYGGDVTGFADSFPFFARMISRASEAIFVCGDFSSSKRSAYAVGFEHRISAT